MTVLMGSGAAVAPGHARVVVTPGHPAPPVSEPKTIVVVPGTSVPASVPGPATDSSDFYAIFFALIAIVGAIIVARVAFRRGGGADPLYEEQRPTLAGRPPPEGPGGG